MMRRERPRYYVVKKGKHAYWQPTKKDCERFGVERKSLGHHGFGAMAIADQYNQKLDALRSRRDAPRREHNPYPRASLGKFWWKWSHRPAFYKLAPSSQREWEQAWKHIGPELGNLQLRAISPADIETFADKLEKEQTEYVRWRTLNKLRELFNAAVSYPGLLEASPCGTIENPQPDGRTQIYMPHEIPLLVGKAVELKQPNMALAIRAMYEAALAPIDSYTITVEMVVQDAGGWHLRRERQKVEGRKNKRPGIEASISDELARDLLAHASRDGRTPHPKSKVLVRDRTQKPWTDPSDFSSDFRAIRDAALPDESARPADKQRKALDIRRTANVEADIGGADRNERAKLLANSIDTNDRLHATYTPPTAALTRQVNQKRAAGRQAMIEALKFGTDDERKVGTAGVS